jgi:hypothetical protein
VLGEDLGPQRLQAIDAPGHDRDVVTTRRQASREFGAETRRSAGDQGWDRG